MRAARVVSTSDPTRGSARGPIVRACDVTRRFGRGQNAVIAVHAVTCHVAPGRRIALVGPSGSGKSTLLHLLAGLDRPTSGTISWPALHEAPRRPGVIGIVFQAPSLLPALNVAENVALPLVLGGTESTEAKDRALEVLGRLGLSDVVDSLPDELSGGQSQRVAVARALVGRPQLILADEPTGQLDHVAAGGVVDALFDAADLSNAAIVVATHDQAVAARFSSQLHMVDGSIRTRQP